MTREDKRIHIVQLVAPEMVTALEKLRELHEDDPDVDLRSAIAALATAILALDTLSSNALKDMVRKYSNS